MILQHGVKQYVNAVLVGVHVWKMLSNVLCWIADMSSFAGFGIGPGILEGGVAGGCRHGSQRGGLALNLRSGVRVHKQ